MRRRNEYRVLPYRPSRDVGDPKGTARLILRFIYRYVWPHKWPVLLCILFVSLNACSVYLQSYYGRVVVDEILVVGAGQPAVGAARTALPSASGDRAAVMPAAPRPGDGAEASEAARLRAEARPAWAGRRLFSIFVVYLLTILVLNFADRATQRLRSRVGTAITQRLRRDIHDKIIGLSTTFHLRSSPGRLMSRILADVGVVEERLMELVIQSTSQVVMFIAGVTILLVLNPVIAAVVILAMIPYALIVGRVRVQVRRVNREIRHTNACLWGLVSQKLDAMKAVIAYGRERAEYLSFHRLSACLIRDTLQQQRLGAGMNRAADVISAVTVRGIFIACTVSVIAGQMTLGQMMYIHTASAYLFVPVVTLTQIALHISNLLVVLHRMAQTFETEADVDEDPQAVAFPLPLQQGIRFKEVTFAWSNASGPVLDAISLDIPAARWVCIMGASGSGKTTLLQLLARLFDPQEGSIEVDGVPLDTIRFDALRRSVALVPQEAQILSGTIRDNITYGHAEATPSEIMAVARAADCHDFIMDLPVKYETIVGEKGTSLSGGQRQRISIARALLTHPDVLLLDDCTSALDAETERRLQETLAGLMVGKTAVIVSQRVSMAMRCHRVVVLDQGRIIENDAPARLIANEGVFAALHRQQTA
jgi:ABC-type multidrug transport system fused ATPase/permease subunit